MYQLSNYPHLRWYIANLRSIPGGSYHYGASPANKRRGTKITISPFRMGATPVTWGMWKEYRQSFSVPGKEIKLPKDPGWGYPDDHPVVNVSWEDIMDSGGFCEWASGVAGFKLTLPTDAQWEYAARGGKDGMEYPWGDNFDSSRLWCSEKPFDLERTAAVDRADRIYRNAYGLTDMVGNVKQWCTDFYNPDYLPVGKDPVNNISSSFKDLLGNARVGERCLRGGPWIFWDPSLFAFGVRACTIPQSVSTATGFRLAAGRK